MRVHRLKQCAVLAAVLVGAAVVVYAGQRRAEDTVLCTDVNGGDELTVLWHGRREFVAVPGLKVPDLRYTAEMQRAARVAGMEERELFRRRWLVNRDVRERVEGKYVTLEWPRGRGARDADGRLVAAVRMTDGGILLSGSLAGEGHSERDSE